MASESEVVNEYWESLKYLPHNQSKKDKLKLSYKKGKWCSTRPVECDGKCNECKR